MIARGKFRFWREGIEFIDHGDAEVDEMWRERLGAQRLLDEVARMCPDDVEYDVPPEYVNAGRIEDSWFICMDILSATESGTILK
jgi:hypothetical protein